MNRLIRNVLLVPVFLAAASGCTYTFNGNDESVPEEVNGEEVEQKVIKQEDVNPEGSKPEENQQEGIQQEERAPTETGDDEFEDDNDKTIMVADINPALDYSGEVPDCRTAAQRIAENVQVGMRMADVRRLVGRPKLVFPGSWWWTEGLSLGGRPNVRFSLGVSENVSVSSVSSDSSKCR